MSERNEERTEAVYRLLKHKNLGVMLGLAIIFLGLSFWTYFAVLLFLYCFMEWHDMNGYKFLASNGNTADDYSRYNDNQYRERDVENVMAYKMDNAVTGGILLLVSSFFTYKMYGIPETIWLIVITLIWYFSGVKEIFFYNPFSLEKQPNAWWYDWTFYGIWRRLFAKDKTIRGKAVLLQGFIGFGTGIILTIIWVIKWKSLIG